MLKKIIENYKTQKKENKRKELLEKHKEHFNSLECFSKSISELRTIDLNFFIENFNNSSCNNSLILNIEDNNYKKKILKSLIFHYLKNNLTFVLVDNSNLLNNEDIREIELFAENSNYIYKINFSLFSKISDLYINSFILKVENQNKEIFSKYFLKDLSGFITFKKEIKVLITDLIDFKRHSENYDFINFLRVNRKNGVRLVCFYDSKETKKDELYFCDDYFFNKITHIRESIVSKNYNVIEHLNINVKAIQEENIRHFISFIRKKFYSQINSSRILEELHEEYFLELDSNIEKLCIEDGFILESFFINDSCNSFYDDVEYKPYHYEKSIVKIDI